MGRCSTGNNGNNGRGLATFMPPSLSSSANVAKPCPQGRAKLMTTTNGDPPAKQRNTIEAKWALLLIENLPQALPWGTFSINSNSLDSKRSGKIMSFGRRHDSSSPFVSAFYYYHLLQSWQCCQYMPIQGAAQTCCSWRLSAPEPPGGAGLLGKPRTAGRCKHAAAAACLLQYRTQLGGRTSSLSACTMLLCFNADNSYCGIPYFIYVLLLPIISCRPKHLSISLLPASSTSNFRLCMKSLTNFGQFMELLSKPGGLQQDLTQQHCCFGNHSTTMQIRNFCGTLHYLKASIMVPL